MAPNRVLSGLALAAAALAAPALAGTATAAAPGWRAVDRVFEPFNKANAPGCAVGVFRNGRVLHARGFGMASLDWAQPITPATVFELASASKQFTAFGVLLLQSQGRLSLQDDVGRHLSQLPAFVRGITLEQLMRHTSGMPNYLGVARWLQSPPEDGLTVTSAMELIERIGAPAFAPGEQWSYSDDGYLLLAQVIEHVSGQRFAQFMATQVFAPLGMRHTRVATLETAMPGRAQGHRMVNSQPLRTLTRASDLGGWGVNSTLPDLARWMHNQLTGQLGGRSLKAQATAAGHLNDGTPVLYGGGIQLSPYRGLPLWSHNGDYAGYHTQLMLAPSARLGVAVLCNRDDADAELLARRVVDTVLAGRLQPALPRARLAEHVGLVGHYIDERGLTLELLADEPGIVTGPPFADPLQVAGPGRFEVAGQLLVVQATPPAEASSMHARGGDALTLLRHTGMGHDSEYRKYVACRPTLGELAALAGRYRNPGTQAVLEVESGEGQLALRLNDRRRVVLAPAVPDVFIGEGLSVRFVRDAQAAITGAQLNRGRLWRVPLERLP